MEMEQGSVKGQGRGSDTYEGGEVDEVKGGVLELEAEIRRRNPTY
jgi:hypothetical protein